MGRRQARQRGHDTGHAASVHISEKLPQTTPRIPRYYLCWQKLIERGDITQHLPRGALVSRSYARIPAKSGGRGVVKAARLYRAGFTQRISYRRICRMIGKGVTHLPPSAPGFLQIAPVSTIPLAGYPLIMGTTVSVGA